MGFLRTIFSVLGIIGVSAGVTPGRAGAEKPVLSIEPDEPVGFGYKICWFAIRTKDGKAVRKVLELIDPQPANWRSGITAAYNGPEPRAKAAMVFVSPPVDGWTFVVGAGLPYPADASPNESERQLARSFRRYFLKLAMHFDDVQFFGTYRVVGFDAWARARNGRVERIFSYRDGEVTANEGAQTPEEARLRFLDLGGRSPREATAFIFEKFDSLKSTQNSIPNEQHTIDLAGAWSIDPTQLERRVEAKGSGFVGLLSYDPLR